MTTNEKITAILEIMLDGTSQYEVELQKALKVVYNRLHELERQEQEMESIMADERANS